MNSSTSTNFNQWVIHVTWAFYIPFQRPESILNCKVSFRVRVLGIEVSTNLSQLKIDKMRLHGYQVLNIIFSRFDMVRAVFKDNYYQGTNI